MSTSPSVDNLYASNEYLRKNPSLHEEDHPRKVELINPFVDRFAALNRRRTVALMDVGGGTGHILHQVYSRLHLRHGLNVTPYSLDLSPGCLEIQKKNCPALRKTLNEDVCGTSLGDKEIDLALLIDVLEHVPADTQALRELSRVSRYLLLRCPLEDNIHFRLSDWYRGGAHRRWRVETLGHIHAYSYKKLRDRISRYAGNILTYQYSCYARRLLEHPAHKARLSQRQKIMYRFAAGIFAVSPPWASKLFTNSIIFFVECFEDSVSKKNAR